jgi:hypothetical protein
MKLDLILKRNAASPASHTVSLVFSTPPDFPGGGIINAPGLLMKSSEQTKAVVLSAGSVKVTLSGFMVRLSPNMADGLRNIHMLKERAWLDIPIV